MSATHYGTVSYPPDRQAEGERAVSTMLADCRAMGLYGAHATETVHPKSGRATVRIIRTYRAERAPAECAREAGGAERLQIAQVRKAREQAARRRSLPDPRPVTYMPLETPETPLPARPAAYVTLDPDPAPIADPRANLEASGRADAETVARWNDEAEAARMLADTKARVRYVVAVP